MQGTNDDGGVQVSEADIVVTLEEKAESEWAEVERLQNGMNYTATNI
jgi:hypothetical protein